MADVCGFLGVLLLIRALFAPCFMWWSQVSAIFFANSYAALALSQVSDKIMTFLYVSGSI